MKTKLSLILPALLVLAIPAAAAPAPAIAPAAALDQNERLAGTAAYDRGLYTAYCPRPPHAHALRHAPAAPSEDEGPEAEGPEAEAPEAKSLSTVRNDAVASSSESASSGMVAAKFGESGRKRTVRRLCPREVISVFTTGVSSWVHSVRVVSTTGPGREIVQFRSGFEISFGLCVSQRWREISKWKFGE